MGSTRYGAMRNISFAAATFATALLTGCGGGGGVGSTPTPVPTPTPIQRNTTLTNLQFSESFANRGATLNAQTNMAGAIANISGTANAPVTLRYDAPSQSYTITANGSSQTFAPADRSASESRPGIDGYVKNSGNTDSLFLLFKPGTSAGGLNLTYSSYGAWLQVVGDSPPVAFHQTYFVFGVPTQPSDLPRTGTATYDIRADGFWAIPQGLFSLVGSGNLSANFAANQITTQMTLTGDNIVDGQPDRTFGTLSGSGTISASEASFAGTLGGSGYNGTFNGLFFGPQAAEAGATFSVSNSAGGAASGVIIGKKN